jgi:hypothetical protein
MSTLFPTFPIGSVGHNLMQMRGIWHDQIELFELDGSPLNDDIQQDSGSPGASPFDNLVYVDFDGHSLKLTNVHLRGRPLAAKSFTGQMRDGILVFDALGPGAYENIGMSGGPGVLTFNARQLDAATGIYMEPDFIVLTAPGQRVRHTILYRHGLAKRTLTARGTRLLPSCEKRHPSDPRGPDGPVHEATFSSPVWQQLADQDS